jgi:hypothetical protein
LINSTVFWASAGKSAKAMTGIEAPFAMALQENASAHNNSKHCLINRPVIMVSFFYYFYCKINNQKRC